MRRATALLLALALALSLMTSPVLAADITEVPEDTTISVTEPEAAPEPEEEPAVEVTPDPEPAPEAPAPEEPALPEPEPEEIPEEVPVTEPDTEAPEAEEPAAAEEPADEADPTDSLEDSGTLTNSSTGFFIDANARVITLYCSSGTDIRTKLYNALKQAKSLGTAAAPYTVTMPKGTYNVSSGVFIYSNTILDLNGSVLTYTKHGGNMLVTGDPTTRANGKGGYKDFVNITVKNGTLKGNSGCPNCIMRMAHGANILLENITFDKCYGFHEIEFAGINGMTIRNCTFKNIYPASGANTSYEAIELDILANDQAFAGFINDGTPLKNITITGCTFSNVPRGIGAHNQLLGSYHSDINISNNTFTNVKALAIFLSGCTQSTIENNTLTDVGVGIYFSSIRNQASGSYTKLNGKTSYKGTIQSDFDSVIRNNKISAKVVSSTWCNSPVGIQLFGHKFSSNTRSNSETIPAGTYLLKNVDVSGNIITTTGNGIRMDRTCASTIFDNKITYSGTAGKTYYGVQLLDASKDNVIDGNTISKFPKYNIRLTDSSSADSICYNTISGSGSYGIYVDSGAADSICGNTITSAGSNGIYLHYATAKSELLDNTISGCSSHPIKIHTSTSYVSTLQRNIITSKTGQYGIYASKGTISASDNQFTGGTYTIYTASGVKGNVFYNAAKTTGLKYSFRGTKTYTVPNLSTGNLTSAAKATSTSIKLKWAAISNASGYIIQYSTNSNMSGATSVTVSGGSTVTKTLSSLTAGKTYYIRIRAYRTCNSIKLYGKFSSKKSVVL